MQIIFILQSAGLMAAIQPIISIENILIQLFLYCFAGELLSSKINMISFGAYESLWYQLPAIYAKDIYFILMRATIPFRITAGKLLDINMDTFSSIIKTTFSFFSVLRMMLNA